MRLLTLAPLRRAHAVRAVATLVLTIGYADLVRGGTSVSAVLLVVGYMMLVPLVLLTW